MVRITESRLKEITSLAKDGSTTVNSSSARFVSAADPVDDQDLSTKAYADANPGGSVNGPVRYERIYSVAGDRTSDGYEVTVGAFFLDTDSYDSDVDFFFQAVLKTTDEALYSEVVIYNLTVGFEVPYTLLRNGSSIPEIFSTLFVPSYGPNMYLIKLRPSVEGYVDGYVACQSAAILARVTNRNVSTLFEEIGGEVTTTNSVPVNTIASIPITENETVKNIHALITAKDVITGNCGIWILNAGFKRNLDNIELLGSEVAILKEEKEYVDFLATLEIDGTDAVNIVGYGHPDNNVRWKAVSHILTDGYG